jgi:hypothetical protein
MIKRHHIVRLSLREYLPLLITIAMWAVIVAAIGHADTARLFAATVMMRAVQLLTRMNTAPSLKARIGAPRQIRRQARRIALAVQGVVLTASLGLLFALVLALDATGQHEIAAFLPLIAIGLPARALRISDVHTDSTYYRLSLACGGLLVVIAGWAAGVPAIVMGLAFGAREWIAYAVLRWWPKEPHVPARPIDTPLFLSEIARTTAVTGRRLLTYRLAKVALTIFGPFGNFAARTGRGMGLDRKIEPYIPHSLSGFVLFAVAATAAAAVLVLRIGEPAAMIGAAGLMQLAGSATNIALMWHYLPRRDDPDVVIEDDDEV